MNRGGGGVKTVLKCVKIGGVLSDQFSRISREKGGEICQNVPDSP